MVCAAGSPALRHDLLPDKMDEASLVAGDIAGLYYSLYELPVDVPIPQSVGEPFDTNANQERVRIKGELCKVASKAGLGRLWAWLS